MDAVIKNWDFPNFFFLGGGSAKFGKFQPFFFLIMASLNHQAKRVDSRSILLLIATYLGALTIWIVKQTNTSNANQTNKVKQIKLYTFHSSSVYSWPQKIEHLIIFEDIYKLWFCFELWIVISMKCLSEVQWMQSYLQVYLWFRLLPYH